MPTNVIMPALELAQETGKVLRWLKATGDRVAKGDPIVEIETDKVTVEIAATARHRLLRGVAFYIPRDTTRNFGNACKAKSLVPQGVTTFPSSWETGGREFKSPRSDQLEYPSSSIR
jgi:hypothetical protein